MFDYHCETCGKGTVKASRIRHYEVLIFDEPFRVPLATIGVCDRCGARNFDGREMHRWERLYKRWQVKRRQVLSPEQIQIVRESLRLSQKDFARFLGVSRQSIAAWERERRFSIQPLNVDILLQLLYAELDTDDKPVTVKLLEQYQRRTGVALFLANTREKRTVNHNNLLQKILPRSTWEILSTRAQINRTEPYMEVILAIESARIHSSTCVPGKEIKITSTDWKNGPGLGEPYHITGPDLNNKQVSSYTLTGRIPAYEC